MSYSQNKDIINQISEFVAQENKKFFSDQIQSNVQVKKYSEYLKTSDNPFVDTYGRVTFHYANFDDVQIPFYQPGTITFQSAINPQNQEIIVCHNGCQQNGPILGLGCSLFIARFMGVLAQKYSRMAAGSKNDGEFDFEIYKIALLATLSELAAEDATQHGRILEMREWLLNFSQQKIKLEPYEEVYFYLKELQQSQKISDFSENEVNNAKFAITQDELKKLQKQKQEGRVYASFDKYFREHATSSLFHSEHFAALKEFIKNKKGIFLNQEESAQKISEFLEKIKEGKKFLQSESKILSSSCQPKQLSLQKNQQKSQFQQNDSSNIGGIQQVNSSNNLGQSYNNNSQKLEIPKDFLRLKGVPKYLQKGWQEDDNSYQQRVYNFLNLMSSADLVKILCQVDPSRQDFASFLNLTSEILRNVHNQ